MPYLIYNVSKLILGQGLTPVLNTDYSYTSSNNAYKKVGFEETDLIYSFSSARHLNKKKYYEKIIKSVIIVTRLDFRGDNL